jgi:hypothetical protein
MRIIRLALDEAPAVDYARLVAGSAFASPGFLELWGAMRGRPVVHLAQAGGEFVAVLPGVEYGTGPATRLASLPDGWYGGVRLEPSVADDRPRITRALYDAVVGWGYAKIAVFDTAARGAEHPALSAEPYETLRADISAPDWAPPDRTLRQEIRKAGREGLRAERFDWARHRAGFLELVAATARRRGERPRYPARLFERLAALAERDDRVIWRVVTRVAERAGVRCHVHALRAAFATFYLEQNPEQIASLQMLMGHESIATTQVYLRKLNRREQMERVRDLSWNTVGNTSGNPSETASAGERSGV